MRFCFPLVFVFCFILGCFFDRGASAGENGPAPQFHATKANVFRWEPVEVKFLRLYVERYQNQPCIDELEVFEPGSDRNIALARLGVKATASSCYPNNVQHKVEHINDGLYGNAKSWIPAVNSGWIQLEFPEQRVVDRIAISRDRGTNPLSDRCPDQIEVAVSHDGQNWNTVCKIERFGGWLDGNNNDRPMNTPETVRRAVLDMIEKYGELYPNGGDTLRQLDEFDKGFQAYDTKKDAANPDYLELRKNFSVFQRRVLLANPVLDFDQILVVRGNRMTAPNNNFVTLEYGDVPKQGYDNELAVLSDLKNENPKLTPFYRPPNGYGIAEPELHWDADRVLFSSVSTENGRWNVFEVKLDGTGLRTLTPTDQPDVDFFDACYVPDGSIITTSTATMQGLPCMNGGAAMVNLFKVDPATKQVRQLTFEQDSDWHPTMMRDGRVMYMRWEYTDIMHYFSRFLFYMNPDGTLQRELYGSGSMFPTTLKHAREIPDSSELIVILSGHHGRGDTGRLAIIDPTVARKYPFKFKPADKAWGVEGNQLDVHPEVLPASETGFIQEIPGFGRDVVGNVVDNMADGLKYNFVFPYPLSKNYFLVNCQIEGDPNTYGLYLTDRFDNMTLIKKIPNQGLFNPIPLVQQPMPPVLPDRVDLESKTANVFITDIYDGTGMPGVPRDTVKKLRIFSYHFNYTHRGGHDALGIHNGWDVKRILGEVDVESDGSTTFEIPSNTPVSLQPLDEKGRAIQLMRSWLVGMPGENVSCNGCHESQLDATPAKYTIASRQTPKQLTPFFDEARSISFETEVYYPIVKKYCMDCHDGTEKDRPSFTNAQSAYDNIHPFVRRPGPESDMDVLRPMEYHASTSELCRMLEKNHYHVLLDEEAWRRLYCWIDLNAPRDGKWNHPEMSNRRKELEALYSSHVNDYENDFDALLNRMRNTVITPVSVVKKHEKPVDPSELKKTVDELAKKGIWPFNKQKAQALQKESASNGVIRKTVILPNQVEMGFVRIPAGTFVMGNLDGYPDESPRTVVEIVRPFWMSETEVTNAQYAAFDPIHDTRYQEEYGKDHIVPGYIANHPDQPVSRISWDEAGKFAEWFSSMSEENADLPTEAEWEWAARGGTETQFPFGTLETDFSDQANLAGAERQFLHGWFINGSTVHIGRPFPDDSVWPLRDTRFSDKWHTVDYVAQYAPNPWGLYDMIGNNCEWTKSSYQPYPYHDLDGRNDMDSRERKTARGGSWHDRPKVTGSATRYAYEPWQKVYNVGIRLILR